MYLVNNASDIISIANIVNFFKSRNSKTNYETLSNYISHLESTFLVHKVERYNIKGKETISANNKYYLNYLCYHNYLYSGFGYGMGYLLENAVYLSLRRAGYQIYVGTNQPKFDPYWSVSSWYCRGCLFLKSYCVLQILIFLNGWVV